MLPKIGDRVLVFSPTDPQDMDRKLFVADPRWHLLIERGPDVFAPQSIQRDATKSSFDDVLRKVRGNPHFRDLTANE